MPGIGDQVRSFSLKVDARRKEHFVGVVEETERSIKFGSELTGAPGQPVDEGVLLASWQTVFESPDRAIIGSGGAAEAYNKAVEDGIGPHGAVTYGKNGIGGSHSVKLTVANFDRISDAVAERVKK